MSELIKEYTNLLNCINEIYINTSNRELKEQCKSNLINILNTLYKKEQNNINEYLELFDKYNLSKEKFLELNDVNLNNDYIIFSKYEKELENIFINPNEDSIKVWLKNIIDFGNKNNISEKVLNDFINEKFKLYDKENKFVNNIDKYINDIKTSNIEINKKLNVDNVFNNTYEEIDQYVHSHFYLNNYETLGKKLQEIMLKINTNLIENNEEEIKNGIKEYFEFINSNDKNIDKEKMMNYLFNTLKKQNKQSLLENYLNDVNNTKKDNKPLKILNMKKSFNSKIKNKSLAISALAGLGVFTINPLFGIALGFGGYHLYKKGLKSANKLIEKNGYKIDENDNLVDKSGKIVTNEDISKLKYNLIRRELERVKDGKINKDYKKNRLTSILLNNNIVKNLKGKFEIIKKDNYESPQLVKDINKGMRNVK